MKSKDSSVCGKEPGLQLAWDELEPEKVAGCLAAAV